MKTERFFLLATSLMLIVVSLRLIFVSIPAHAQASLHEFGAPPESPQVLFPEVKPYAFAELPHGRIYKAVHEGCELWIVESDFDTDYHNRTTQHTYSVTAGRGCK
jgi:hypothetical protein